MSGNGPIGASLCFASSLIFLCLALRLAWYQYGLASSSRSVKCVSFGGSTFFAYVSAFSSSLSGSVPMRWAAIAVGLVRPRSLRKEVKPLNFFSLFPRPGPFPRSIPASACPSFHRAHMAKMRDAGVALVPDFTVTWRVEERSGYTVQPKTSRVLRIREKRSVA